MIREHSIVRLLDKNNHQLDFHRFMYKNSKRVLTDLAQMFKSYPTLFITKGLYKIVINYTDYECTPENETCNILFDDFLEQYCK